jgi:hypothetical protein
VYSVHQIQHTLGLQQHPDQARQQVESGILDAGRTIQTHSNVFQSHKFASDLPNDDKHNIQMRGTRRLVLEFHG